MDQTFHMIGGLGETSYASNSRMPEKGFSKAKAIVEESVSEVYSTLLPENLVVADLGCSSGPNTFLVISEVMNSVSNACRTLSHQLPEIMFLLNDLPGNDFNTLFKSLTLYDKKVRKEERGSKIMPYYVSGIPGSFYRRLFPKQSVHFMHSAYSLHWLSQVPQGLESDMVDPVNRGNIYISATSPSCVFKLYLKQFQHDFSSFLGLRCKEIISGGQMVITILGRSNLLPIGGMCYTWELLADALNSLVTEGLIEKAKVDAFNLPFYAPAVEEVKEVVCNEGSFELYQIKIFELNWDPLDNSEEGLSADYLVSGKNMAKNIRAVLEPMLIGYFGEAIIDVLFSRYAERVAQHLMKQKTKYVNFTLALRKKG